MIAEDRRRVKRFAAASSVRSSVLIIPRKSRIKKILTIICFCISIGSFFGTLTQNHGLAHSPATLIFTDEGCRFAKSIGLKISMDNNECTAVARFDYYRLGGGGSIRLDDDKVVVISNSSLLAWRPAEDDTIADTPEQKGALLRYWIFLSLAILFTVASFKLVFGKNNRPSKNDAAP